MAVKKKQAKKKSVASKNAVVPAHEGWGEGAFMILIIVFGYLILKQIPGSIHFGSRNAAGLGAVFLIGLTAAFSTCMALVGGLLVSVSAKWYETYNPKNRWDKFRPLLQFNVGRLIGYFLFGGIVGLIGTALAPTVQMTGVLTIVIAIVMIMLGLNILKIVPKKYCSIPLPRSFVMKIRGLAESKHPLMPGLLGALTFFVPCGFTQSMQILALASGSFLSGALIMFVFALGTLPSLLGISAASSMLEGSYGRHFFKFAGAFSLFLGLLNLNSGFILTGVDLQNAVVQALRPAMGQTKNVTIDENGKQIITITVTDDGYYPNNITIDPGIDTWIYAVAPNGVSGCATMLTAPTYNLSTPIQVGENWLGPIKNPTKDFVIACSMGMLKANIHVKQS